MIDMKKALALFLALGLLAGLMVGPAAGAKKKKKKKAKLVQAELTLYMRWDDDGAGGCGGPKYLSTEDGEDPANGCSFVAQGAQEVVIAATGERLANDWPATEGVPFKLDASRPLSGSFAIRGHAGARAWLEVAITGTAKDSLQDLAVGESEQYTMPTSSQLGPTVIEMEFELDKGLDKLDFTTLNLNTAIRGVHATGYIDLEAPSFITIPVWVKA
jgi:hypothetical protein